MGALQLEILRALWAIGPASVAEVHAALARPTDHAPTTIATMLRKMEARGLVSHREDGRRFIYAAVVAEAEVAAGMAGDVLDRAFNGSVADLVQHLLTTRDVSPEELDELAELIAARRKKRS